MGRAQRIEELFNAAADQPADRRSAFLADACGGDARLRAEIESLLAADSSAGDFLERPAHQPSSGGAPAAGPSFPPGHRIGDYEIVRLVASGGMGMVYEAVQDRPRRPVALKIMRPGVASPAALRRFEYEADLLGRLSHPGIARIYQVGAWSDGGVSAPYFAMEFISEAQNIVEFAHRRQLDVGRRVQLFLAVCEAVQHGHQRGVIHRDLKPANILVDGAGVPKVIDFGVARAANPDLATTVVRNEVGQLIGTLQYMSPEQLAGDPAQIDTRCDVYALGAVLYELLSGRRPFDLTGKSLPEAIRVLTGSEPPPLAAAAGTLRGDLELICRKALERDKARRYASASELAADLRRCLHDEPITARPPTALYQLRKFARRNRALAAGVAVALVGLLGGAGFAVWKAVDAAAQRDAVLAAQARIVTAESEARQKAERATLEAAKAEAVNEFLRDMLASARPDVSKGPDVTVKQALDEAGRKLEAGGFAGQPLVEAAVRATLAQSYNALGLFPAAEPHLRSALALFRQVHGDEHIDVATVLYELGGLRDEQGAYDEAAALYDEAMAIARRLLGDDHVTVGAVLNAKAGLLKLQGRLDEADALYRRGLEIARKAHGSRHEDVATSLNDLALLQYERSRFDEARALFEEALAMLRATVGERHTTYIRSLNGLAMVRVAAGDYADAVPLFEDVLRRRRELLGDEHPAVATSLANLGVALREAVRPSEAEPYFRQALDMRRRLLGDTHPDVASTLSNLAVVLRDLGACDEAEQLLRESLALRRQALGESNPELGRMMAHLASLLNMMGDTAGVEELYRGALTVAREAYGHMHPAVADALSGLATHRLVQGEPNEAAALYEEATAIRRNLLGPDHQQVAAGLHGLGDAYRQLGRLDEAEQVLREALLIRRAGTPPRTAELLATVRALANVLVRRGEGPAAALYYEESIALCRSLKGRDDADMVELLNDLGMIHFKAGSFEQAEPLFRESLAIARQRFGDTDSRTLLTLRHLTFLVERLEDPAALESLAREAAALLGRAFPPDAAVHAGPRRQLSAALLRQGRAAEAETAAREGLDCLARSATVDATESAVMRSLLGASLSAQGRLDDAEPLLREAFDQLSNDPAAMNRSRRDAAQRLADHYKAAGQEESAAQWRERVAALAPERTAPPIAEGSAGGAAAGAADNE